MKSSFLPLFLVSGLGLLAAACNVVAPAQADPTRYYVLAGPAVSAESAGTLPTGHLRIGLKNVVLAGYLKGQSMVVRGGANEIVREDFARWGEPLEAGIARILHSSLAGSAPVARVYSEPFPLDADRDYDVAITINRCEGGTGAGGRPGARFEALIEITKTDSAGALVARKLFVARESPWDGKDFGRLAGLLSDAISALGGEIIAQLPLSP